MTRVIKTKPATQTTQSKTSAGKSRSGKSVNNGRDKGRRKPKNNTPLIIGGIVGFFLLIIVIVAVASQGKQTATGTGDQFLTASQKQEVYHEYVATCKQIEAETERGLNMLSAEDRRRASSMTYKKLDNLKTAAVNKLQGKWEKKIANLPPNYIKTAVIDYGKSQGW